MKKYPLYIITISLVIASLVLYIWLSPKSNEQQRSSEVVVTTDSSKQDDTDNDSAITPNPTNVSIAHTNEELCKAGDFTRLLDQEVDFNKEIVKDRFVQYLRLTLNNWISGKYGSINEPKLSNKCEHGGLLRSLQCPDAVFMDESFGIPEIGEEYLKSKFIVLKTDTALGGGASIVLMFKDKPDKVFYAWVYRYYDNDPLDPDDIQGFDLRGLSEYTLGKNNRPNIEEIQKMFITQLCNQEIGI